MWECGGGGAGAWGCPGGWDADGETCGGAAVALDAAGSDAGNWAGMGGVGGGAWPEALCAWSTWGCACSTCC